MTGGDDPAPDRSWLATSAAAVAVRPRLWVTGARQLVALAEPGWWRRAPRLPLPPPAYLRFRMETAYGDPAAMPCAGDVVRYLDWCRDERRRAATSRRWWRNGPAATGAGR